MNMTSKPFQPTPGLTREAEEKRLAEIIGIAQSNLTRTVNSIRQLSDDLYEIYEQMEEFEPGYWNYEPDRPVSWTARAGNGQVAVDTEKIAVRIDKRTGALRFFDQTGKRLLAEKAALPRQIGEDALARTWVHFDLPEHEKIFAKGILKNELMQMNHKARYISFDGKKPRMPLLVSQYGYGIGIGAEETVMCCMIPMYGTYLYTEGKKQIDYYFLYGGDTEAVLRMYQKLAYKVPGG